MSDCIDMGPLQGKLPLNEALAHSGMVVADPAVRAICQNALQLAQLDVSVLILGESGTGKDCLAKLIHRNGSRAQQPFVRLNCGAIPDELFEAELFGYERNAFTGGLYAGKEGLLEAANGGTIFLDEIGEMTPENQVKLLRFLESGQTLRIGASVARTLDVRIVCATHRDLVGMIDQGLFRQDLYYRICVVALTLPPLRDRPGDVAALAKGALARLSAESGVERQLTQEGLSYLQSRPWRGNVRQLQNLLERICALEDAEMLDAAVLRRHYDDDALPAPEVETVAVPHPTLHQALADFERSYIAQAVERTRTLSEAAALLGLNVATLHRKKRQYGLYKRRNQGDAGQDGTPFA